MFQVEGKLKSVANPLTPARMEKILSEIVNDVENSDPHPNDPSIVTNDDEVSINFYGTICEC